MSKAVLVLDEMPLCCEECRFTDSGGDICCLCNKDISEHEYQAQKPDWCPLRELPEKEDLQEQDENYIWSEGWNACINEITRELEKRDG